MESLRRSRIERKRFINKKKRSNERRNTTRWWTFVRCTIKSHQTAHFIQEKLNIIVSWPPVNEMSWARIGVHVKDGFGNVFLCRTKTKAISCVVFMLESRDKPLDGRCVFIERIKSVNSSRTYSSQTRMTGKKNIEVTTANAQILWVK